MKRILSYFFVLTSIMVLPACTKSTSDRLVGIWQFEKVKLHDFGKSQNLTEQYLNSSVQFNEDGTVSYYNFRTDEIKEGTWEIYSYETWNNNTNNNNTNNTETITDLYIFLLDTNTNTYGEEIWKDINISSNKITTTVDQYDGSHLSYKLVRVKK